MRDASSSQLQLPGHPRYEAMMRDLRDLFDAYQEDRYIHFLYTTGLYFGPLRRQPACDADDACMQVQSGNTRVSKC